MKLLEPFQLGPLTIPNRIVLPAMVTRLSGEDGLINQDITDRYLRFALGEVGLIVMEAMAVHTAKSGPLLRIGEDRFIPGLRELVKKVHDSSPSKILPQIIHFLKIARSGWRQKIEDLSKQDINDIIVAYGDAAARAREAGFDGVELHMAHAYTLASFLSARNGRKDEYGGSLENRMRLGSEVVLRVREKVGDDFAIGVRFLAEECIKRGFTLLDSREIALRMSQLGVQYISLSAGGKFEDAIHKPGEPLYPYTGYSGDRCMPGDNFPDAHNLYLASSIKEFLVSHGRATPVVAVGKISTAESAEQILVEGKADLIGMARALLADPYWVAKVKEGRERDIVQCIYCNVCKALDENFKKVVCYLWPKGNLQAPLQTEERELPKWQSINPLAAEVHNGKIKLQWQPARHFRKITGYDVFRSENKVKFTRVKAVPRLYYEDHQVVGGRTYYYYVQAYDADGNHSYSTNLVEVYLPTAVPLPTELIEKSDTDMTQQIAVRNLTDADARYASTVRQMMASQAYRELAAAQLFGHGLKYVPGIKYQKFMTWHITEEMQHYEMVVRMYSESTGDSVEPVVWERLAQKPVPLVESWFELAMAQFLYDRGGFWQLQEYEHCSFEPYRLIVDKIIKEERGHQGLGEEIAVELCRSGEYDEIKQESFNRWLRQGLLSFGRPNSEGSQYAISMGLKKRDAGIVMGDFIEDIKPAMKSAGLQFPNLSDIGIDAPAGIDLSLN
jgi:2,4-dienoyl-CoA reductase-like NADH-dependent reductase (Old Yellow Enzyme family)/1,2-phenylacetyl-CoA epoxidase catalytic subunit